MRDKGQPFSNAVIPAVVHYLLGATHGQRRLGGDLAGQGIRGGQHGFGVRMAAVDQADASGLRGINPAAGHGQFPCPALADIAGQTLQRTQIGDHADIHFLDREKRIAGSQTHVGRQRNIQPAANAGAMNGGNDRLAAMLDAADGALQTLDGQQQFFPLAGFAVILDLLLQADQHLQVNAGAEMLAIAGQDNGADFRRVACPVECLMKLTPQRVIHRIGAIGAVQFQVGNLVFNGNGNRFKFQHDSPMGKCWTAAIIPCCSELAMNCINGVIIGSSAAKVKLN